MQLDRAAPVRVPFLVQVEQQIGAPVKAALELEVEIDVAIELLAVDVLVRPAAKKGRIAVQILDAGHRRHRREEFRRQEIAINLAVEPADVLDVADHSLAAIFAKLIAGELAIERRKVTQQRFRRPVGEEVFDANMLKGLRGLKALPVGRGFGDYRGRNHPGLPPIKSCAIPARRAS